MCGIFGVFHPNRQIIDLESVEAANNSIRHRGPDDEGYLLCNLDEHNTSICGGKDSDPHLALPHISSLQGDEFHLALAFRRLSILDLSPAGHQPMPSRDRRYWIVYNGEIYNYLELRAELAGLGHEFTSASDTEVILAAYQQWGQACLQRFNGMWAFAIWDNIEQSLFLSRDRFGIKPLYYRHSEGRFAFASEIKALVGRHGIPFQPQQQGIYRYLATGLLPGQKAGDTFFKDIHSLPPGHWLLLDRSGLRSGRYWQLAASEQGDLLPLDEALAQFRQVFESSVKIRLRSDVAVGSCLSGGLDSSAIVSTIHHLMADQGFTSEQLGDIQQTFSAVYDSAGPHNESRFIELLLKDMPVRKNLALPTSGKLRAEIENMVWHQEEPFPTTSIFAQWCVMQKARQQRVTVLLDGQGADELMGGYRPFAKFLADHIRKLQFGSLLNEMGALQHNSSSSPWKFLLTGMAYANPATSALLYRLQNQMQTDLSVLTQDFRNACRDCTTLLPQPTSSLDEHLRLIFEDSNLPDLLRYEDRNSMAFSIESRVPFLDYRLVELLFGPASSWRMKNGWTKYLLRMAMDSRLPDEIAWRKDKVGFATPETLWMRQWMQESHREFFNDCPALNEYVDVKAAQAHIVDWLEHQGKTPPVWRWINLNIWLKQWQSV